MSFWGGVAKGFEAGEAKREREEVRDTAAARNVLQDKRWQMQWENTLAQQTKDDSRAELADARLLEAHGLAMAKGTLTLTESINKLGGGTSGGTGSTVGARSSKTGPTAIEMDVGARALQARIDDLGGLDSMTSADQAYYKPILGNAAASYELNKLLAEAVGDDEDLTILNAADRVRTVAIVAAQGQEAFAAYSKKAAKDGWSPEKVLEAMELAKGVNPAFAELVLLTPSRKNLTEQEQFNTFEAGLQFYIADWKKNNPNKVTDAFTTATSKLKSSNEQIKNEGLSTLVSMGVGQDWILKNTKEGNALRNLIPKEVSAVPKVGEDGKLVTGGGNERTGTPTYTAAELLELPPAEARKLVGTRIIVDGKPGTYGIPGTSTFEGQTGASDDAKAARGTGRLSVEGQRKATELDDMFKGADYEEGFSPALNSEGVSASEGPFLPEILRTDTRKPDDRPEGTADEIIGRGSSSIEALIGSLGETGYGDAPRDKALQVREGVLSELAGMGITMPTNPTELGYFKEDLKALLVEDNVDISGDLLSEIVDIAKESANKGTVTVPAEVKEAVEAIKTTGTEADIEQAAKEIAAEFGEDMAGILFDGAKSARGTGKSAVMDGLQVPYTPSEPKEGGYTPPSMGATEPNTPAVREAIANVPAEVKDAVETVIAQGTEDEVEQAKQEIADEFGEVVAAILFDDLKSARGTGKSAVMDGLQTP